MPNSISSENLLSALADAVVAADAQGLICWWNPAAEKLFGYDAQHAIGQSLDLITPERYRERHWAGYRQAMQSGHSRYGDTLLRVPALHSSGQALSIAMTVSLLRSETGEVDKVVAVIRDETKRFEEEKSMRARLAQLEAQHQAPGSGQQ